MKSVCHSCTDLLEFHVNNSAKVSWHQTQYVNLTCNLFLCRPVYTIMLCRRFTDYQKYRPYGRWHFSIHFCFQEIYVVRVVPYRRISAVFQFLCIEHRLPFFESWRAWAASIERRSRLGTFTHLHHLIYIDNISKIIVDLNNVHLLQATLISTKSKL